MLKGNQKKLDKNKDGKISGEDFKLMKKPEKANLGMLMMKKAKDKGAKGIEFLSPVAMLNKAFKNKGGEMIKARVGKSIESSGSKKVQSDDMRRKKLKELRERGGGVAEEAKLMGNMKSMGGESKGFGAARTSGMGLQDEELVPGKSLDYYKDIM